MEQRGRRSESDLLALRTQLTSTINIQTDATRTGIRKLETGAGTVSKVRETMSRVNDLCRQADRLFDNYPFIKLVSRAHANFTECRRVYEQFKRLNDEVEEVETMLASAAEGSQTSENMLVLYYRLSKLLEFQKSTMSMAQGSPQSLLFTLKRYFKKLDDLNATFESLFWDTFARIDDAIVRNASLVVASIKIVTRMPSKEAAKTKLLAILDAAVQERFATDETDIADRLKFLSFYEDSLLNVRNRFAACFPPEWQIMDFYLSSYHRGICRAIAEAAVIPAMKLRKPGISLAFPQLTSQDLLRLMTWIKRYGEFLSQFAANVDMLDPKLLDGQQEALISDYVKRSGDTIGSWIGNLRDAEEKSFRERLALPEADADNHYFTPAAIDLFQIVKQHVTAALEASRGRLSLEIVRECCRNVLGFQRAMIKVLQQERDRFLDKPEACAKYFEDYVIMMGNSCLRWIEYLGELMAKIDAELAPEFVTSAGQLLRECNQGFLEVAKLASAILTDVIFESIKPVTPRIFSPSDWYDEPGSLVSTITATFDDFFHDYREKSEEFLFAKLVADVLDRLVLAYLDMMRAKGARFRQGPIAASFSADTEQIVSFFRQYRDQTRVEKSLDPVMRMTSLIAASEKMILLEFFAMFKLYPDVPLAFVEEVLMRRDDLEKPQVRELISAIKKKIKEEKLEGLTAATVFGKLTPSGKK